MTATALAAVGSNANENGTLLISGTAVTASGTSVDFTGIPSWVKRITVMVNGVSLSGASSMLIQVGSGSITTTGYVSSSAVPISAATSVALTSTAGFIEYIGAATNIVYGHVVITNVSSNIWVSSHSIGFNGLASATGGGNITLSGVLDRVRITTANGTDTFDAGSINIMWE